MPSDLSVIALIAAYNEADIIGHVVADLIEQGVGVYFLDDGSTDSTIAAVEPYLGRGVLAIERFSKPAVDGESGSTAFQWERILWRKTQLAKELDADWFIHHDADEFRESPWPQLSLQKAIGRVDALGFNAIDFQSFDFWPVDDRFQPGQDVRASLTGYMDAAPHDRLQIRCWKKAGDVDLASTGGHEARFNGRHVFPLRFILRHYPIRGQAHGERKVFGDRRRRFLETERAKGWHVQYDDVREGSSFIRDPSTLTPYDPDAVRIALALRHRGVEDLEASVDDLRVNLERVQADLARTCASLEARRLELEKAYADLGAVHAELGTARAELETRDADLLNARADIGRWRHALDDATRRLEAFERSLSWRWTAPVRALYRLFRRHA